MPLPTHFELNTGGEIPTVRFGTWQAKPHEVEKAVEQALRAGYRHIDCAAIYRNETEVGAGIRASGIPRSDIFITSKLWNTKHLPYDVEGELNKTLKDLGTDYLDLFLMHWPVAFKPSEKWLPLDRDGVFELADIDCADTYLAMEKLHSTGKVRAIGVCNFNQRRLDDLLTRTNVVPAVNQIEAHPYLQQRDLLEYCKSKGILVEAYSPLGNNQLNVPRTVDDPAVQALAAKIGLDAGQMLYSWGIQRGTVVLPKSVTPHRIESNLQVKELPTDIFDELTALERHKQFNTQAHWGHDIFDELGEDTCRQIAHEAGPENLRKFTA